MLGSSLNLKAMKLMLLSALAMIFLVSCGGGSGSNSSPSTISNNGVAQKGPFSIDSKVTITKLDASGISTGTVIESKVTSKSGSFLFKTNEADINAYYRIQATGHYLDENAGSVSEKEIRLEAITKNPSDSSVNVLTHWQSQRTDALLAYDKTFKASLDQSQKELFKIFGIQNSNALDITTSSNQLDEENALLLLLSGALMEASQKYRVSSQIIIDEIGKDFADDGQLSEKGDDWFIRLQALIKDNPSAHTKKYAKAINDKLGYAISLDEKLPSIIPLASRPVANVPTELLAEPSETITLDGSASHDSGDIINFTWFRVDQQTQYNVQVSDRFIATPTITVPDEPTVLAAPNQEISLLYALVVTDTDKLTHTGLVKVIIKIPSPLNNPPVADSQLLVTDEDTPIAITLSANDDGDSINFVLSTPLATPNGLVELDTSLPNVVYTPTQDYFGTDSFTFIVNDGFMSSNTAMIDIQVNPVNDPPIANPQSVSTLEGQAVNILLTGSDIENSPLTFSFDSIAPQNGLITGTLPNITYTPNSTFSGDDQFNFIVNDGFVDSTPAIVLISVETANQIPIANTVNKDTNQNVPILIQEKIGEMSGTDADVGDSLTIVDRTSPSDGTITESIIAGVKTYEYAPDPSFYGVDSFTYKAFDGKDKSIEATVTINVNGRPTAYAGIPQTVNAGSQVVLNGTGSDPEDGANVTYSWSAPTGVILDNPSAEDPSFTAPSGITTITFSLVVTDQKAFASKSSTVVVTVNPSVNNKPTAESFNVIIIPSRTNYLELRGADLDVGETDSLKYEIITAPTKGTLLLTGAQSDSKFARYGAYSWSIPTDISPDQFTYRVTDVNNAVSDIATVTLSLPDPQIPIADAGRDETISGGQISYQYGSGYDIDGTIEKYVWRQIEGEPVTINTTSTDGRSINFIPPTVAKGETKELKFGLIVDDNDGNRSLEDTVLFTVVHGCYLIANAGVDRLEISRTNPVPLYGSSSEKGNCSSEGGSYFYDPLYIWEQVDDLGVTLVTGDPNIVTLLDADTYSPSFEAPEVISGSLSLYFKLQLKDNFSDPSDPIDPAFESDIVKIDIIPTGSTINNQKPVALTSNLEVEVSRLAYSRTIDLRGNDPDGDNIALTYRIIEKPVNVDIGSLSGVESNDPGTAYVTYTPKYPVSNESYSFKFIAIDHYGAESDPVEVTLTPAVVPIDNNPPVISNLDIRVKNSELSWRISRKFSTYSLEENAIFSDEDDDYFIVRKETENLNGLIFNINYSNFSFGGWGIYIDNPDGSALSSGTVSYFLVDEHGAESEIATFTVTGD